MQRLDSVDVLRALALIGMVICHYPIFLSSGAGADAMLYFFSNHLLGGDCGASLENVLGFFLIGQFPLLPWIIFPVAGFVVGRRITQKVINADSPFILIIGMLLVFMGLFTAYAGSMQSAFPVAAGYVVPLSFYPLSFSMALFLLGVVLVLYILLWRICDFRRNAAGPGLFLSYCRQISKYSLTIYVTHFALFFIPLRLIFLATGKYYLRDAMSTPLAFALAVLLLILYYPLLKLWDKADGKYSFEWLLARMLSKSGRATAAR